MSPKDKDVSYIGVLVGEKMQFAAQRDFFVRLNLEAQIPKGA